MKKSILLLLASAMMLASCSENYSNGERIGVITQFSRTGIVWKSWEGHLNVTQTGMNSSVPFDFSIDNDKEKDSESQTIIKTLDSAASEGWKVKLVYHEVKGWNFSNNRGDTNHFITKVEVLERDFGNAFNGHQKAAPEPYANAGHLIDTMYLVIYRDKK